MKLVDRVLENISSQEITQIASSFGLAPQNMSSIMHAMIPGVLSAVKARIVSSMNSGDTSSLMSLLDTSSQNLNTQKLFDDNPTVMNTLYQRISEFSGVDQNTIESLAPNLMPVISGAVTSMLKNFGTAAITQQGSNFMTDLLSSNSNFETAITSANDFISSIFGTKTPETELNSDKAQPSDNNQNPVLQNLFDLFDQDNDGSVMDDIYRMLVR
jgi:hypothetical protein